jgi:exopolysaccharide biosynthesis polyprenyl glycosylphosphotransferase
MAEKRAPSLFAIAWTLRGIDMAVVGLVGLLTYYLRFGRVVPEHIYLQAYLFVTVSTPFVFHALRLYDHESISRETQQFRRLGWAVLALVLFTLAIGFLTKTLVDLSRIWISLWGPISILALVIVRIALWILMRGWQAKGWIAKRVALVGSGPEAQRIARQFAERSGLSQVLIGVYDDRRTRVPNQIGDSPIRGTVDDLLDALDSERIEEVIIALPWTAESRVLEMLEKLRPLATRVRLAPGEAAYRLPHRWVEASEQDGILGIYNRPISSWSRSRKRIEDIVISSFFLLVTAPMFLGIALAVKASSRGPVFTRLSRYDFTNRRIEVIRFRTHIVDHEGGSGKAASGKGMRPTGVGRFLRKARLHELPALINVLRGDMSVVGPEARWEKTGRDHSIYERIAAEYFARHNVKPGITGWARIHGFLGLSQVPATIERRIEYDLDYVDRWSVWFDLLIILMSPFAIYVDTSQD